MSSRALLVHSVHINRKSDGSQLVQSNCFVDNVNIYKVLRQIIKVSSLCEQRD